MFGLTARKIRLEAQTKRREVNLAFRRIIDEQPQTFEFGDDLRANSRSSRSIPVLLIPFDSGTADAEHSIFGLTKDFSDTGAAVVHDRPFASQQVVIGFLMHSIAGFVRGEVRGRVQLGGGFWQLCIELMEMTSPQTVPSLELVLAKVHELLPQETNAGEVELYP